MPFVYCGHSVPRGDVDLSASSGNCCHSLGLLDFTATMEHKTLFQIKGRRNQVGVLILTAALTSMDLFLTMYVLQEYRIVPVDQ